MTNGGVSKAGGGSTGGSKSSTSSWKPTTTSTSSDTQPKSGEYGKTVGDFPTRDVNKGGTVAATGKGTAGHTAGDLSAEAGRAVKNVTHEATRAPQNVADFLTGKNDSDKQLIRNVQGGLHQAGEKTPRELSIKSTGTLGWLQ